ncbi:MAG: DUF423 domain-containing protein [Cyclobacteriaceae bacterium]|nr:DUF423 domain-containing protein [Cyclobacteriaceae bacterium]
MINSRQTLLLASFTGFMAVALGAFGAHALKQVLVENNRTDTYELAVRYHFYHTLALLVIGTLMDRFVCKWLSASAICMIIGTLLFSGSLYLLALTNNTLFAIITPIGGVILLMGWGFLFISAFKKS